MSWKRLVVSCASIVIGSSAVVGAAPFCLQMTGIPLQCLYVDPGACQQEAARQGGICASNPNEFTTPAGGMQFCVVEPSNVVSCNFGDRATCMAESRRRRGACVAATPPPPGPRASAPLADDPFAVKRPY